MLNADPYLETKVMTATPYQLHMMVIDGALRHATRAREALENDDFETAHFALNDSRDFVSELISGLNSEQAPDVVEKLKALFAFVYKRLVDADLKHDIQLIDDALRILRMHRETWESLGEKLATEDGNGPAETERRSWTT